MHNKNKRQNNRQKPDHGGNNKSHLRKRQESSYKYGKLYPGRYNTPPLREDLVPRSRMAPEGKRKRKRRGNTKLLLWHTSETMNLERLNKLKERKNTTELNELESTPLEKRNKEHYGNLKVAKT